MTGSRRVTVERATPADEVDVRRLVDGALLSVDDLADRIEDGTVLLATSCGTAVGAVVLAPEGPDREGLDGIGIDRGQTAAHVRAIAVRRRRRGQGVGRRLMEASCDRFGPLLADFEDDVAPFYEALGATVREGPDGRRWALLAD